MKLTITIDEKELIIVKKISDAVSRMIVHEYSQVPTGRSNDKTFNRLRSIVLKQWYENCGKIIKQAIDNEANPKAEVIDG